MSRTFEEVSKVNRQRSVKWHADGEPWSLADWGNALGGEVGELQNFIKKIRRIQTGTHGRYSEQDIKALVLKALLEVADVFLYLDLVAEQLLMLIEADQQVTLDQVVANKFNFTSEEHDFEERL